jgi:hypothetical protein
MKKNGTSGSTTSKTSMPRFTAAETHPDHHRVHGGYDPQRRTAVPRFPGHRSLRPQLAHARLRPPGLSRGDRAGVPARGYFPGHHQPTVVPAQGLPHGLLSLRDVLRHFRIRSAPPTAETHVGRVVLLPRDVPDP